MWINHQTDMSFHLLAMVNEDLKKLVKVVLDNLRNDLNLFAIVTFILFQCIWYVYAGKWTPVGPSCYTKRTRPDTDAVSQAIRSSAGKMYFKNTIFR